MQAGVEGAGEQKISPSVMDWRGANWSGGMFPECSLHGGSRRNGPVLMYGGSVGNCGRWRGTIPRLASHPLQVQREAVHNVLEFIHFALQGAGYRLKYIITDAG